MRTAKDFWSHAALNPVTGCLEWRGAKNPRGYGKIMRSGKTISAHRHAYELSKGSIPHGGQVLHRCDNPSCVNPEHLFIGSNVDNMRDMSSKGRASMAKLTPGDVERVRDIWRTGGRTQKEIAEYFGVTHSAIGYITRGDTWKEVA